MEIGLPPDEQVGLGPPPDEVVSPGPPPDEPKGSETLRQVGLAATAPVRYARAGSVGLETLGSGFLPAVAAGEDPSALFGRASERVKAALEPGFQPQGLGEKVASGIGTLAGVAPTIAAVSMAAPALIPTSVAGLLPAALSRAAQGAITFGSISGADELWNQAAQSGQFPTAPEEAKALLKGSAFGASMGFAGAIPALVAGRLPPEISQGIYRALIPRVLGATAEAGVGGAAAALEGGSPTDVAVNGVLMALAGFMGNEGYDAQFKTAAINQAIKPVVDKMVGQGLTREAAEAQVLPAFKRLMVETVQSHPDYPAAVDSASKRFQAYQPGMTKEMADKAAADFVGREAAAGKLVKIDELARLNVEAITPEALGAPPEAPKAAPGELAPPGAVPPPPDEPPVAPVPETGAMVTVKTESGEVSGKVIGYDPSSGHPTVEVQSARGDVPPGDVGDVISAAPEDMVQEEAWISEGPATAPVAPATPEVAQTAIPLVPTTSIDQMKPDEFKQRFPGVPDEVYVQALKTSMEAGRSVPVEAVDKYPELQEVAKTQDVAQQNKEMKDAGFGEIDPVSKRLRSLGAFDLEALKKHKSLAGYGELKSQDMMNRGLARKGGYFTSFDHAAQVLSREVDAAGFPLLSEPDPDLLMEKLAEEARAKTFGPSMVSESDPERYYRAQDPSAFVVPDKLPDWMPERLKGAIDQAKIVPGAAITSQGFTSSYRERIKRGAKGKFLAADLENGKVLAQFGEQVVITQPWNVAETYQADKALGGGQPPEQLSGRAIKSRAEAMTGVKPDQKIMQLAEAALLRIQLLNQQKGSIIGARAATRTAIANFKTQMAEGKEIRQLLARFARESLVGLKANSIEVGQIARDIANAKDERGLWHGLDALDRISKRLFSRHMIAEIRKIAQRIIESPGVDVLWRQRAMQAIADFDVEGMSDKRREELAGKIELAAHAGEFGQEDSLPAAVIAEVLRANRRPLDSMDEGELVEIFETLQMQEKEGRIAQKLKEMAHQFKVQRELAVMLEGAQPLSIDQPRERRIGEPMPQQSETQLLRKELNTKVDKMQEKYWAYQFMDALMERLGPGFPVVKAKIDAGYSRAEDLKLALKADLKKLEEELKLPLDSLERIHVVLTMAQAKTGGPEHIQDDPRCGQNPKEREKYIASIKLTPPEQRMANAIKKAVSLEKSLRERVAGVLRFYYNRDIQWLEDYYPFVGERAGYDNLDVGDRIIAAMDNKFARKNLEQGFSYERTPGAATPLRPNALANAYKHLDAVANLVEIQPALKIMVEAMNKEPFRRRMGATTTQMLRDWATLIATNGGPAYSQRVPLADWVRGNISMAYLSWRIGGTFAQVSALANAAGEIGAAQAMQGFRLAFNKDWSDFAQAQSPELRSRIQTKTELEGMESGVRAKFAQNIEKLNQAGFYYFSQFDFHAAKSAWIGKYIQSCEQRGVPVDFKKPDARAAAEATRLMRDSQGSWLLKDLPLALTGGWGLAGSRATGGPIGSGISWDRMLAQFQTYTLARWSYAQQIYTKDWEHGSKADAARKWSFMLAGQMLEWGIKGALAWKTLSHIFGNDSKDDLMPRFWTKTGRDVMGDTGPRPDVQDSMEYKFFKQMLGMVPFASNLYSTVEGFTRRQVRLPIPVADAALQTSMEMTRAVTAQNEKTRLRAASQALVGLSSLGGVGGVLNVSDAIRLALPSKASNRRSRTKRAPR